MSTKSNSLKGMLTENFSEFSQLSDYSFMNQIWLSSNLLSILLGALISLN